MDVAALTRASQCVVRAPVSSVSSQRSRSGRITTSVELERLETWAGLDLPTLRMSVPGGVVGEIGQRVEGAPSFVAGEEVVLFLAARGTVFQPVGLGQGVWRVGRGTRAPPGRAEPPDRGLLVRPAGPHRHGPPAP